MIDIIAWLKEAQEIHKELLDKSKIGALPKACAISEWDSRIKLIEEMRCSNCFYDCEQLFPCLTWTSKDEQEKV